MKIRKGNKDDMLGVLQLIQELAVYENAPDEVEITETNLIEDGFGTNPLFECYVAEDNKQIVGLALFYYRYSTWKGKNLYLEDLVVKEEFRRKGIGSLLFEAVIKESKSKRAKRMEWQVLDWNEPAIEFYKKYKCQFDDEWTNCKFTFDQLQGLNV